MLSTLNAVRPRALETPDVDAPLSSMRRRLQERELVTTAVMPGGVMFEDAGDHFAYHLAGEGAWRSEREGDAWIMVHPAGHRLAFRGGHMHMVVAK